MESIQDFCSRVLAGVTERVSEVSGTPPPHFVIEDPPGELAVVGPLFANDEEKAKAPRAMAEWIRKTRPSRLAFVMEAAAVSNPTPADLAVPVSQHPRRRDIVMAWFFAAGSRRSDVWEAPVIVSASERVSLGPWQRLDANRFAWSGELFDPVLKAMSELQVPDTA